MWHDWYFENLLPDGWNVVNLLPHGWSVRDTGQWVIGLETGHWPEGGTWQHWWKLWCGVNNLSEANLFISAVWAKKGTKVGWGNDEVNKIVWWVQGKMDLFYLFFSDYKKKLQQIKRHLFSALDTTLTWSWGWHCTAVNCTAGSRQITKAHLLNKPTLLLNHLSVYW